MEMENINCYVARDTASRQRGTGQGDWGAYNVKLKPISYQGKRFNFYLHGGSYPGTKGCIDVLSNIKHIYRHTSNQAFTLLRVKY